MIVEDIGAYLQANGIGTLSVDLFLHVAPDKPDDLMSVTEYSSDPPQYIHDKAKVEIELPRIQIAARSMRPEVGRLKAERAYQLLMAIHNGIIGTTRYLWCQPVDSPAMVGRDENGRFITTVNFRVSKELSSV
jgi:hypothetical protein